MVRLIIFSSALMKLVLRKFLDLEYVKVSGVAPPVFTTSQLGRRGQTERPATRMLLHPPTLRSGVATVVPAKAEYSGFNSERTVL